MDHAIERFSEPEAMAKTLSRSFDVGFALEGSRGTQFSANISSFSLGGSLKLAELHLSPHRTSRARRVPSAKQSYYLVNQLLEGECTVCQDGREAEVREGDIYLINPARDFQIETSSIVTRSLYVEANAFRSVYPEVDCCAAIALRGDDEITSMVAGLISSLFLCGNELPGEAGARCGEAFPHVLAIALSANIVAQDSCPSRIMMFHKQRIKSFVREHLSQSQLSCEMIADALNLSQRYIYDVFSDEPMTLMRWIRSERLKKCRRELSSSHLRNRSVGEIAYAWGFVDLAHFSRVFSAEFGTSPRAFRHAQMRRELNDSLGGRQDQDRPEGPARQ